MKAEPVDHKWLMLHDAGYREARNLRLGGILVTSVGSGIGAIVAMTGLFIYGTSSIEFKGCLFVSPCDNTGSKKDLEGMALGKKIGFTGLGLIGLSLGTGLPLAVLGHRRMKRIRQRWQTLWRPSLRAGVSFRGPAVSLSWRF